MLDTDFHQQSGGVERWASLLAEPESLDAIRALQSGTFTGRPVGGGAFVQQLETQLRRELTPHQGRRSDLLKAAAA